MIILLEYLIILTYSLLKSQPIWSQNQQCFILADTATIYIIIIIMAIN